MKTIIVLLLLTSNAFAMCNCKADCKKDIQVMEFSTNQEAIVEAKKHKQVAVQKYGNKYQLLIWDEEVVCESTWPETCQCDDQKY